jgi:uncharacterized delta-60 repeat protein
MKTKLLIGLFALAAFEASAQDFDPTFNTSGWREDTIGAGVAQSYNDIVIQGDNKVLVSGLYDINNFIQDISVVRYNVDGSLDNSFGTGGKLRLVTDPAGVHHSRVAQNTAGEIFLLGSNGAFCITKLSSNGTIDNSFGTSGTVKDSLIAGAATGFEHAYAIAVQSDGKILIAGYYHQTSPNTEYAAWVIRYNTNGTRDNSFGTGGLAKVIGGDNSFGRLLIQPDGKILAGGASGLISQQQQDWFVCRFNTDGTLDNTFGPLTDGTVKIGMQYRETVDGMALQSDGSIIIGGPCGNGNPTFRIIKISSAGLPSSTFGTAQTQNVGYTKVELQTFTDHYFAGLAVLPGDKIAIAGSVSNFKFAAIRFNADGTPDNSFGTNSIVDSQFVQAKVYMSGAAFNTATGRLYAAGYTHDDNAGTTSSAVVAVKVASPNSVQEITNVNELGIYPNPAGSTVYLDNVAGDITVFDMTGRNVVSVTGREVNVSQLTPGLYLLKCTTKNGEQYSARFTKN